MAVILLRCIRTYEEFWRINCIEAEKDFCEHLSKFKTSKANAECTATMFKCSRQIVA